MAESRVKPAVLGRRAVIRSRLLLESGEIDGRSSVARGLAELRRNLTASLGGESALSEQQSIVIGIAARTALLLDSLDNYLFSLDSLVNKKRRCVFPIVEQRSRLSDSLLRQLTALGLRRLPGPSETLSAYIERVYDEKSRPEPPPESQRDKSGDEEPLENAAIDEEQPEVER